MQAFDHCNHWMLDAATDLAKIIRGEISEVFFFWGGTLSRFPQKVPE